MTRHASVIRASLCRIARLDELSWSPLERGRWATGDYVVGEVVHAGAPTARIELCNGRMIAVGVGDLVVGALGVRHATLEATGTWEAIEASEEPRFDAMTGAGLFGQITSISPFLPQPIRLAYRGHVRRSGEPVTMRGEVEPIPVRPYGIPTILIVGSSMSAGKTATGRIIVRRLKRMGLKVLAAKVTGAGRYRDVLTLGDAGADHIYDFVDVGMPSTVCAHDVYRSRATELLSRMASEDVDVAVVEAGASPLEPYNGAVATELLDGSVRMTVLCASDPYAVLGIQHAFDQRADLVAGIATNTDAGIELIEALTGLRALRLIDRESLPILDQLLERALGC